MHKYTQEIRDFINNSRNQFNLLKNRTFWNQLCSSLDVIEDSDLAIDAYINGEFGEDDGEKYLRLYGVVQALILQQDAETNLCEALKLPNDLNPELKEIRHIRNDSIGHPTKRGNHESYHFISRTTITKSGFQLISDYGNNNTIFRNIPVTDLIKEQRKCLSRTLKNVIDSLKAEEKAHKEEFKMEKLEDVFPSTLSHHIEEIFESIGKPEYAKRSLLQIAQVKGAMDKLKESLHQRGIEIDTYDSIKDLYDTLEYPITELELYFDGLAAKEEPGINDKTAYIFAYFVRGEMHQLKERAKEIDDEYSN